MSRAVPSNSESDSESDGPSIGIIPLSLNRGVGTSSPPPLFQKKAEIAASHGGASAGFDLSEIELVWSEQPSEYHRARYPKELSKRGNCRGAIEGRERGVPTIQLRGLADQPQCPAEVDLTVYVCLPDARRHPFFYCLTAGRDAPTSCQAVQLEDQTHALRLKARAEDNFVCQLKHVGIVRLRQELLDADKLGITSDQSSVLDDCHYSKPQPPSRGPSGRGGKSTKAKPEAQPSHNNYFRLRVVANIETATGSYLSSMSESIKCVSSTQLVQNPHVTQILSASQSLIVENTGARKKHASQPELFVFGKDFASNTRFRVFQRLADGQVWKCTLAAKDFSWLCGHHCCVKLTLPTPPPELLGAEVYMDAIVHSEKSPCTDAPLTWRDATLFNYPAAPWTRPFCEAELYTEVVNTPTPKQGTAQRNQKPKKRSRSSNDDEVTPPNKKRTKACASDRKQAQAQAQKRGGLLDKRGGLLDSLREAQPQVHAALERLQQKTTESGDSAPCPADCQPAQAATSPPPPPPPPVDLSQMTMADMSIFNIDKQLELSSSCWSAPSSCFPITLGTPNASPPPQQQAAALTDSMRQQLQDQLSLHQDLSLSLYDPKRAVMPQFQGMADTFSLAPPSPGSASCSSSALSSALSCPRSPESLLGMDAATVAAAAGLDFSDDPCALFSPLSDVSTDGSTAVSATSSALEHGVALGQYCATPAIAIDAFAPLSLADFTAFGGCAGDLLRFSPMPQLPLVAGRGLAEFMSIAGYCAGPIPAFPSNQVATAGSGF